MAMTFETIEYTAWILIERKTERNERKKQLERIKWNIETNSNILCHILFSHSISNSNFARTSHPNWNSVICVNYSRKHSKTKRVHVYIIFQMYIFISLSSGIFPSIRQQNTVIAISSMIQSAKFTYFQVNFFYNNFFSSLYLVVVDIFVIWFSLKLIVVTCFSFYSLFFVILKFFAVQRKKSKTSNYFSGVRVPLNKVSIFER